MTKIYIIYEIRPLNKELIYSYVGSTENFKRRKSSHKKDCSNINNKPFNRKIYEYIRANGGWLEFEMVAIEEFECDTKIQARIREQFFINQIENKLNTNKAYTEIGKKERDEIYRSENKEKIVISQKKYREKNKEKIIEKNKIYYEENKEKIANTQKIYNTKNKEKMAEYNKKYQFENKEKIAEEKKIYVLKNKEKIAEINKRYREKKNKNKLASGVVEVLSI